MKTKPSYCTSAKSKNNREICYIYSVNSSRTTTPNIRFFMNKEIKLTNKKFAETLLAFLNEKTEIAKLAEADGKFVISYEVAANKAEFIKADGPEEKEDDMNEKLMGLCDYLCRRLDSQAEYFYSQLDSIYAWMSSHTAGHLPALTPSGLTKLVKAAGEEDNYSIQPRTVWASKESGIEFGTQELKNAIDKLNEIDARPGDEDVNRLIGAIKAQRK